MELSVIILTNNSEQDIPLCLNSLYENLKNISHEVIIIDNGSSDRTISIIANNYPDVTLIKNRINKGVAAARNQGFKHSKGDYILILDDDTIILPNSISKLLDFIRQNKDCGLCAPLLLNQDRTTQINALPYPFLSEKIKRIQHKLLKKGILSSYISEIENKQIFEPEYVIGAVQLINRKVIEEVGILDESVFYGPEDADFCLRIRQHNWKIYCLPEINVIHTYKRKSYNLSHIRILFHHILGLLHFWKKHGLWKAEEKKPTNELAL